jgi:hypothetical protein
MFPETGHSDAMPRDNGRKPLAFGAETCSIFPAADLKEVCRSFAGHI